jgi:hypothetical protein
MLVESASYEQHTYLLYIKINALSTATKPLSLAGVLQV